MRTLARRIEGLCILVPTLPQNRATVAAQTASWGASVTVVEGKAEKYAAFAASDVALTASGMATLELALAGVPMIVCYRANPLTAAIARRVVTVPHVAMPNIIADRRAAPEFLQRDCTPRRLVPAIEQLLQDDDRRRDQIESFSEIAARLRTRRPAAERTRRRGCAAHDRRNGAARPPAHRALTVVMALSLVLILIAGINFSLLIPVNKIAGDAGFPNFAYVFWYALGAGLILLIPAIIRRELPQLTVPHLRLYFISATLGFAFPFALLAFVATKLPSGVTVLLITLTPLFTYSLAVIARLERFQPICAAGLLAGIAGVLLIVIPGDSLPAPSMAVWFLIALLIPFGFGALNVIVERFRPPEASSLRACDRQSLRRCVAAPPVLAGDRPALPLPWGRIWTAIWRSWRRSSSTRSCGRCST